MRDTRKNVKIFILEYSNYDIILLANGNFL